MTPPGGGPGSGPGGPRGGEKSGPEDAPADAARIGVLPPSLADQIAAGEVVERPGSIVKELVENAIDAGATRVEVELEGGGSERVRVVDDGRGIHPDDLGLAITRHATSKLRTAAELVEIHTLGFRGEALASIAAVARVEIRSRPVGASVGYRLRSTPGEPPSLEPIGMPFGTQIEIGHLFATVPARRKFLRSEATEVGHCVDAVIRAALVHPRVHVRVHHGGRELLELRAGDQTSRVLAILKRRGDASPFHHFRAERDGVAVQAWFGSPAGATRQRGASFVVVRRRVVRERTLAAVLKQAYGEALPRGTHPVACLFVEPPHGTVDVNVHPQKSEVRFARAQTIYAAVRELVDEGLAGAPWRHGGDEGDRGEGGDAVHDWAQPRRDQAGVREALDGWSRREGLGGALRARDQHRGGGGGGGGYRLGTRAAGADARAERVSFRDDVERLRSSLAEVHRDSSREWSGPALPLGFELEAEAGAPAGEASAADTDSEAPANALRLLTCLPGPVAVFEGSEGLLVADLRVVRAALVRRRMLSELAATGPEGRAPAQGLLQPVVVRRRLDEREQLIGAHDELARLGLELEGFGEDAVLVRAVPAALPRLLTSPQIGALLDRLMPWLGMRAQSKASPRSREGFVDAVAELAGSQAVDMSPRLARRWVAELLDGHEGSADALPGLRAWSVEELLR